MEITTSSFALSRSSSIPRPSVDLPFSFCFSVSSSPIFLNKARLGTGISCSRRSKQSSSKKGLSCNALFGLGVPELVVIAGVAALVFGPKKLPEVGRSIGKTIKSFQQAAKEFESEIKKEPDSTEEGPAEKTIVVSEQEGQDIKDSKGF